MRYRTTYNRSFHFQFHRLDNTKHDYSISISKNLCLLRPLVCIEYIKSDLQEKLGDYHPEPEHIFVTTLFICLVCKSSKKQEYILV